MLGVELAAQLNVHGEASVWTLCYRTCWSHAYGV